MQGTELLATIRTLPSARAAAMLRHAARYPITDPADPTQAEITPEGAQAAAAFGAQLTGFDSVRIFHSPVRRCGQTAESLAQGAAGVGLAVELAGPQEALGIDYILDLAEAGRLSALHGNHFVRLWFAGRISETVIRPAAQIATAKLAYLAAQLQLPAGRGRCLDLHVSHDWNIIILRELMLQVLHEEAGWLTFLDGVFFSAQANRLRAVYREHTREQLVPWRFEQASSGPAGQTSRPARALAPRV
jgi:hypothetical protein